MKLLLQEIRWNPLLWPLLFVVIAKILDFHSEPMFQITCFEHQPATIPVAKYKLCI